MSEIVGLVSPDDLVSLACVKSLREIATMKLYESIHLENDGKSKFNKRIRRLRETVQQDNKIAGYIRHVSIQLSASIRTGKKVGEILMIAINVRFISLHLHHTQALTARSFLTQLDLASHQRLEVLHIPISIMCSILEKNTARMPASLQQLHVERNRADWKTETKLILRLMEYVQGEELSSLKRITLQSSGGVWPEWEGDVVQLREVCKAKKIELDIPYIAWEPWAEKDVI